MTQRLAIRGSVVRLLTSSFDDVIANGVVWTEDGRVEKVTRPGAPPPAGFASAPMVDVGDSFVMPGLIDLHSHIAYNALPLWHREEEVNPYKHRDIWPGRDGYKQNVGWPAYLLARGAPEALMVYVQVRALAGGTTAIQGWPTFHRRPANQLVRNLDDQSFPDEFGGDDNMMTSVLRLTGEDLVSRAVGLAAGKGLIYHCSEGQRDSLVEREFEEMADANALRPTTILIHCCAVPGSAFDQWRAVADAVGDHDLGGVVWSPFSNYWLYGNGQTTAVPDALDAGVAVCLGTDWGPSGTKNLLGELKVARLVADDLGWGLGDDDLVAMVTRHPGALLHRVWGKRVGALAQHSLADIAVVENRSGDPFLDMVEAKEEHIRFVVVEGVATYGEQDLMRAAGITKTTSVPVGSARRHVRLVEPPMDDEDVDPASTWTWSEVLEELERVRANPTLEAVTGPVATANHGTNSSATGLMIELDMPGGLGETAGPPPPGVVVDVKEIGSLRHDRTWRATLRDRGFHGGLFTRLSEFA